MNVKITIKNGIYNSFAEIITKHCCFTDNIANLNCTKTTIMKNMSI